MSAFKKAQKAKQKPHRERSQPESRQHLGLLQKKKDYKIRAQNFHAKEKQLKLLHKKALEKNPDEYYFKMVNNKLKDGHHLIHHKREEETVTAAQKKLLESQDLNYIQMKLQIERKKLEKLKESLDLEQKKKNHRTIFVDTKIEAKNLKFDQDDVIPIQMQVDEHLEKEIKSKKEKLQREIEKRKKRENELRTIFDKMTTQRTLTDSSVKRTKVKPETKTSAAVYKWQQVRKK